jgi:poly-gamma-glutamate biosynthesis protein PgsC/CapC
MTFETLFIGLLLAVIYVEVLDIYPGGIIVPAYVALYVDQPLRVLGTVLIAFLSLYSYKLLCRYFILFGKRRFVMMVFLGVFWAQLWFFLLPEIFPASLEMRAIGWLIPGLLANNLERQKILPTLASLFTVSIMTYAVVRLLVWIFP